MITDKVATHAHGSALMVEGQSASAPVPAAMSIVVPYLNTIDRYYVYTIYIYIYIYTCEDMNCY